MSEEQVQPKRQLLLMTVEIGDGRKDQITICEDDDPHDLAERFCQKHDLDEAMIETLKNHIIQNLLHPSMQNKAYQDLKKVKTAPKLRAGNLMSKDDYIKLWKKELQHSLVEVKESRPYVSEKSKKLALNKCGSESVHDRLHKTPTARMSASKRPMIPEHETMQMSQTMESRSDLSLQKRPSTSQPFVNFGHRLYYKGIKMKEDASRKNNEKKKEQLVEESSKYTFAPSVSTKVKPSAVRNKLPVEEYLLERSKQQYETAERRRTDQILEEQKLCSFNPQLSNKTQKMQANRSTTGNVFSTLHEELQQKREKQVELVESQQIAECSFRPTILNQKPSEGGQLEHIERLMEAKQEKLSKIEEMRQQRQQDLFEVDPESGQEWFKPTVRSTQPGHDEGVTVWEHLFSQYEEKKQIKKEKIDEELEQIKEKSKSKAILSKSEQIANAYLLKRAETIFKCLDNDGDGNIDKTNIDITQVNPKVLKVVQPILDNMEKKEETIDVQTFKQRVQKLYTKLTMYEKSVIISKDNKFKVQIEQESFQPTVNSAKNVALINPDRAGDLVSRLYQAEQAKQEKIKFLSENKQQSELESCSFKPSVHRMPDYMEVRQTKEVVTIVQEEEHQLQPQAQTATADS